MHVATLIAFHNELEKIAKGLRAKEKDASYVPLSSVDTAARKAIFAAIPKTPFQAAAKGAATVAGRVGRAAGKAAPAAANAALAAAKAPPAAASVRAAPMVAKAGWSKGKKMVAGGLGALGIGVGGAAEHQHHKQQQQQQMMMQ